MVREIGGGGGGYRKYQKMGKQIPWDSQSEVENVGWGDKERNEVEK